MSKYTNNSNCKVLTSFQRRSYIGNESHELSEIYNDEINISIWQRKIDDHLLKVASEIIEADPRLQISKLIKPEEVEETLFSKLGLGDDILYFSEDIKELVNMFCYLFNLKRVGFRLSVLDRAMCPRFHVDMVPCRLITTYQGIATEWIEHCQVNRSKLGAASHGKTDDESGVYSKNSDIQKLKVGHVALLKGEGWNNNSGGGLVHRSPDVKNDKDKRLLLTLDFGD